MPFGPAGFCCGAFELTSSSDERTVAASLRRRAPSVSSGVNSMTGQFGTSSLCHLVLPWVTARGKCRSGSDRGLGGPRTPSSSSHGVDWTDCHDPIRHRFDGDKYEVYELQKVRASEGQSLGVRQVERWRQARGPRGNGRLGATVFWIDNDNSLTFPLSQVWADAARVTAHNSRV